MLLFHDELVHGGSINRADYTVLLGIYYVCSYMKNSFIYGNDGQILQQLYSILSANNSFQLFSVFDKPFVSTSLHSVHVTSYTDEIIVDLISDLQPDVVIYALAAGSQ